MTRYCVEVSQNGWEYIGYAYITCNNLVRGDDGKTVVADGVTITFDECIGKIEEEPLPQEDTCLRKN